MMNSLLQHLILAVLLIVWCIIHSATISIGCLNRARRTLKRRFAYYRILYNLISVITLLPLLFYMVNISAVPVFQWSGGLRLFQAVLLGLGAFFLLAGATHYDGLQFLGIRQILSHTHRAGLSSSGGLHTEGILRVTRHPWYVAGLFVLWARDVTSVSLIVNLVLSAYLFIGARLEEKKLVREFGAAYVEYQSQVSMLLPWKWIVSRMKRIASRNISR